MGDYKVCPRCGNPMILVNGKWVCRVCGYVDGKRKDAETNNNTGGKNWRTRY